MLISPVQEVLLSYATGLAPVGTPFQMSRAQCREDIGPRSRPIFYRDIQRLMEVGALERIKRGAGKGRSPSTYRVLRRLEDGGFTIWSLECRHQPYQSRNANVGAKRSKPRSETDLRLTA